MINILARVNVIKDLEIIEINHLMKNTNLKAFSLIELSVVVLIVGVLIVSAIESSRLIYKSKIKGARNLTTNSRVNNQEGLVFWYETSFATSFTEEKMVDGSVVEQWNDNNPQSPTKLNAFAGQEDDSSVFTFNPAAAAVNGTTSGPTYIKKGINGLPTLRFTNNASSAYQYLAVDSKMRNTPQESMQLFMVVKYRGGEGFLLDRVCTDASGAPVNTSCLSSLSAGWPLFEPSVHSGLLRSYVRHDSDDFASIGAGSYYLPGHAMVPGKTVIITLERDYNHSFTTYVDGNKLSSVADSGETIALDPYKIGRHYVNDTDSLDFDVSEIIFFSGVMSKRDRGLIEDYLGKKYNISVNH